MKNADQYVSDIQKSLQTLLQNIQPEMVESMAKHEVTPAQLFVLASLKNTELQSFRNCGTHGGKAERGYADGRPPRTKRTYRPQT